MTLLSKEILSAATTSVSLFVLLGNGVAVVSVSSITSLLFDDLLFFFSST